MNRVAFIICPIVSLLALLKWHENRTRSRQGRQHSFDALLALQGTGRDLWADEHADEYVNRLRKGWE